MKTPASASILLMICVWVGNPWPSLQAASNPTISPIPNQTVGEDSVAGPVSFIIADQDTPGSGLVVSASSSNPALVPSENISIAGVGNNRTVSMTPATNQSGITLIALTVSDADGNTATSSFNLVVTAVNDSPTLDPLPNLSMDEGAGPQTVRLSGISAGAANEAQTLVLTAVSSDPSLVPNPSMTYASPATAGSLRVEPKAGAFGTSTISVIVSDGVATTVKSFLVTVNATLKIEVVGPNAVVTWAATNAVLQSTGADDAVWSDMIPAPRSPYSAPPSGSRFYRLRQK